MVDPDLTRFDVVRKSAKDFYGIFDFPETRCFADYHKREYLNFPLELKAFEQKWHLEKVPPAYMGTVLIGTKGAIWHCFHSSLHFFLKSLGKDIIQSRDSYGYQADEHVMNCHGDCPHLSWGIPPMVLAVTGFGDGISSSKSSRFLMRPVKFHRRFIFGKAAPVLAFNALVPLP